MSVREDAPPFGDATARAVDSLAFKSAARAAASRILRIVLSLDSMYRSNLEKHSQNPRETICHCGGLSPGGALLADGAVYSSPGTLTRPSGIMKFFAFVLSQTRPRSELRPIQSARSR